jgi:hypothetical protein
LGAENQRRQYAKEIIDLKDVLRQSQEQVPFPCPTPNRKPLTRQDQVELLMTEANAMQDLVDQAQNSVNGRQVHRTPFFTTAIVF